MPTARVALARKSRSTRAQRRPVGHLLPSSKPAPAPIPSAQRGRSGPTAGAAPAAEPGSAPGGAERSRPDPVGSSRTFGRLVKRAGVRRITVRLARHTCGTLLAFLKVHPKAAQAILRHSRISTTMDVYTHVVGGSEREAVAMLAEPLEDPLIG
ncbi:tyrosine-type recombinase/integrase [Streptomyces shenzhenensis]|uniref:tyrosine-type recombinase/integrase n=1 Tax=Streptomyces shenzhenensis TaxID=943815 RepID=UPI0035574F83